jgi:hypothetical protein
MRRVDFEKAAEELHALIRECDADDLAAIYENAFGAVKICEQSADQDCLLVQYHEGLEP